MVGQNCVACQEAVLGINVHYRAFLGLINDWTKGGTAQTLLNKVLFEEQSVPLISPVLISERELDYCNSDNDYFVLGQGWDRADCNIASQIIGK